LATYQPSLGFEQTEVPLSGELPFSKIHKSKKELYLLKVKFFQSEFIQAKN
jgi:hypothetical protein